MIAGLYNNFKHWHISGTVWVISDTHFGDKELAAGIPGRPDDETLVKLINSKVGKKDTLIHLGDCGDTSFIQKLKGYKILIAGNHDAGHTQYKRKVHNEEFNFTLKKDEIIRCMREKYPNHKISLLEDCVFMADTYLYWDAYADDCLFDEVYEGPVMIGPKLILSHEPVNVPWAFNLHGHNHDPKHKNDSHHFNCNLDATGYCPINLNQWMKQGYLSRIEDIHRQTINTAIIKSRNRRNK